MQIRKISMQLLQKSMLKIQSMQIFEKGDFATNAFASPPLTLVCTSEVKADLGG